MDSFRTTLTKYNGIWVHWAHAEIAPIVHRCVFPRNFFTIRRNVVCGTKFPQHTYLLGVPISIRPVPGVYLEPEKEELILRVSPSMEKGLRSSLCLVSLDRRRNFTIEKNPLSLWATLQEDTFQRMKGTLRTCENYVFNWSERDMKLFAPGAVTVEILSPSETILVRDWFASLINEAARTLNI